MKALLIFLFTAWSLLLFACQSYNLSNESNESVQLGRLNTLNFFSFPDSIKIDLEVTTYMNVKWDFIRVNHMYFTEEQDSTFRCKFTLKEVFSKGCIYDLKDTILPFKFKSTQKGEYTLHFVDRYGTRTRKLTVY
jgi:hypothetical protein